MSRKSPRCAKRFTTVPALAGSKLSRGMASAFEATRRVKNIELKPIIVRRIRIGARIQSPIFDP
jgi:hypothetical protein